jgi:probable phosphoglycerate mutase
MRHGKTDWNAQNKLQGRTNIPLNAEGRRMAAEAAKKYADIHFDLCYCSPLVRAKETAEIVLKGRNVPIIVDERLIEMSFGIFEGIDNIYQIPDCPLNIFFQQPEKYVSPVGNAESLDDLYQRTGAFIKEIVEPQLQQGKDLLIVGHGAMNSSIICQIQGIPREDFWSAGIENCKLIRLK